MKNKRVKSKEILTFDTPTCLFFKTNGERADNEKGGKRMLVYRLLVGSG